LAGLQAALLVVAAMSRSVTRSAKSYGLPMRSLIGAVAPGESCSVTPPDIAKSTVFATMSSTAVLEDSSPAVAEIVRS
jgi:hypothetical protein